MLVRAPGLEPKSSGKEPFSLLRDLAKRCLEDIRKGRQRKMRRAINRGWVEVRLCHLILHSDGSHEWEMIEA